MDTIIIEKKSLCLVRCMIEKHASSVHSYTCVSKLNNSTVSFLSSTYWAVLCYLYCLLPGSAGNSTTNNKEWATWKRVCIDWNHLLPANGSNAWLQLWLLRMEWGCCWCSMKLALCLTTRLDGTNTQVTLTIPADHWPTHQLAWRRVDLVPEHWLWQHCPHFL